MKADRAFRYCFAIEIYSQIAHITDEKMGKTEVGMSLTPLEIGKKWLQSAQVRPTRQRICLAELLVGDGQNRHVTAESLFASVSDHGGSVSLATVYNTLRAFCDAGLMQEIAVEGHTSYFDTRMDEHPHYYWEDTGILTDAPQDAVAFARMPSIPQDCEISRIDVVIRLREKAKRPV